MLLLFFASVLSPVVSPARIICFSAESARECKCLLALDRALGNRSASRRGTMQLTIRTKVTYGFLILAVGLMLTDVCRLMRAPSEPAFAATNSAQHVHRF